MYLCKYVNVNVFKNKCVSTRLYISGSKVTALVDNQNRRSDNTY